MIWAAAGNFCAKALHEAGPRAVLIMIPAARTAMVDGMVMREQARVVWNVRNWPIKTGHHKLNIR